MELLSQNYYFLRIKKEVERYINKCQDCQLNKHITYTLYEYIQYSKIADYPWQNIIIDFIVKLSKSEDVSIEVRYDNILIVMDKLIKYTYLILCSEEFTAKQTACVVLDRVIRYHRIPESITSDRDKIFKSNFWKTLIIEIGTKVKLLIIYYSQTDEQTERTNQTLETYLQYYINYSQENWVQLLSMTQLTLNNTKSIIIGILVFFANYSRYPNLFNILRKSP